MINVSVRVHEIAREFRVTSKEILDWLRDNGEYVKSSSSTVEAPTVRRLRDAFSSPATRPGERRAAPPKAEPASGRSRTGGNPFAQRKVVPPAAITSKAAQAARALGLDPNQVNFTPPRLRRSIGASKHRRDEWDEVWVPREQRAAWINAGLGDHDVRIAMACMQYGITPDDLSLVVDGRAVWDRLRSNESVVILADMIRVEKQRQSGTG